MTAQADGLGDAAPLEFVPRSLVVASTLDRQSRGTALVADYKPAPRGETTPEACHLEQGASGLHRRATPRPGQIVPRRAHRGACVEDPRAERQRVRPHLRQRGVWPRHERHRRSVRGRVSTSCAA